MNNNIQQNHRTSKGKESFLRASGTLTMTLVAMALLAQSAQAQFFTKPKLETTGVELFYNQKITLYDSIDRDVLSRTELFSSPTKNGSTTLPRKADGNYLGNDGTYNLTSAGTSTDTFDMRAFSEIKIDLGNPADYDAEQKTADGVWDEIEAYVETTHEVRDKLTLLTPFPEGKEFVIDYEWEATDNKIEVTQQAADAYSTYIDGLGSFGKPANGWSTEIFYDAALSTYAEGNLITPRPFSVTDSWKVPTPQDSIERTDTHPLPEQQEDGKFAVKNKIPITFVAQLQANMDLKLTATSEAHPKNYVAKLDLGNTFDSISFRVLDEDGNVVPDAVIVSELGIDYMGAAPGVSDPNPCDLNNDFVCDGTDIDLVSVAIREEDSNTVFDLNSDDMVDGADRDTMIDDLIGTLDGDTDVDGTVSFIDFLALANNFGVEGGWASGDFDGDGNVTFPDFLKLAENFNQTASSSELQSVPEPSGLLLAFGWLFAILRARDLRRRHQLSKHYWSLG